MPDFNHMGAELIALGQVIIIDLMLAGEGEPLASSAVSG